MLDKYAKDAAAWRISAQVDYTAAFRLFQTEDLMLVFPAASMGHLAIEKYLKAALICTGTTICDHKKYRALVDAGKLNPDDCAWGHKLPELGSMLARRRADFNLDLVLFDSYPLHTGKMTLRDGLEMFEPFFDELRYPVEMSKFKTLGPMDVHAFNAIIEALAPFTECTQVQP